MRVAGPSAVAVLLAVFPPVAIAQTIIVDPGIWVPATTTPGGIQPIPLLDEGLRSWRLLPPVGPGARTNDGMLTVPQDAWLLHARTYSDFVLTLEFRLGSERARFAVLTRGWWEPGSGGVDADYGYEWWFRSAKTPEAQLVIQEPREIETVPNRSPALRAALQGAGVWQTLSIMATADRFQVWLNDTSIARAWGGKQRAGRIGVRADDGTVEVRDLAIRVLADQSRFDEAPEAGRGLALPRLVKDVRPRYVAGAIKRKVEGEVVVECVVKEDGSVEAARILRGLDPDLDTESLAAVRQWQFEPPLRDGVPVKVRFSVALEFGKNPK